MSYAPYPAYKDSGVPWLGQVPEAWEVKRLSYATRFKGGSTPSKNEDQFWIDGTIPWVSPKDMKRKEIHDTEDHLSELGALQSASGLIDPGHVMMVVRSGILRHSIPAAINRVPVTVNQDMRVFLPFRELKSEFIYWVIEGLEKTLVDLWSKPGTTVESLETEYVNSSPFPVPSIEEQTAIADFLDKKTAEIDDLIAKKEKLLRLLAEQRTALITHAVTKGLNPNAPMKPSGIDWLGDVPEGWQVKRLKHLSTKIIDGAHFTPTYTDEGVPFLRVTDIVKSDGRDIDLGVVKFISEQEHRDLTKRCKPEKGDLLYSKNGTIGVPRTIDWDWEFSIFVSLCLIKLNGQVLPEYLEFALTSKLTENQISFGAKATSVTNLHLDKIKEFIVVAPPLAEQEATVKWLKAKTAEFTLAIERVEDGLENLQEYRTALITNAVTGKIKVA